MRTAASPMRGVDDAENGRVDLLRDLGAAARRPFQETDSGRATRNDHCSGRRTASVLGSTSQPMRISTQQTRQSSSASGQRSSSAIHSADGQHGRAGERVAQHHRRQQILRLGQQIARRCRRAAGAVRPAAAPAICSGKKAPSPRARRRSLRPRKSKPRPRPLSAADSMRSA